MEGKRPGPWLWQEWPWGAAAAEGGRDLNPLNVHSDVTAEDRRELRPAHVDEGEGVAREGVARMRRGVEAAAARRTPRAHRGVGSVRGTHAAAGVSRVSSLGCRAIKALASARLSVI